MLADYNPVPTLPVADLPRARRFYEGVLGLAPREEGPEGLTYGLGSGSILVYQSAYAGTNKGTAMSLQVPRDAFDGEVTALRDKGISFQTFDADGITWTDGVASFGDGAERGVWFEDPDGNILNLETR